MSTSSTALVTGSTAVPVRRWRALSPLRAAGIPAERASDPGEAAATVSRLVSHAAGAVHGGEISFDGGISSARPCRGPVVPGTRPDTCRPYPS
ncbi:hypothetical protein [Streptomyces minutiscleroticus]|uniref:hypothetical protein n=1 Tax=Streptomyces minutiscleroticus TaxID=68238 RepID=UPI00167D1495|nr:hypothetical protein [Streptomyces minutiscleroticus]